MSVERHGTPRGCDGACCLKVRNLSVRIGGDPILEKVNLHLHCGQLVGLIGPNGAGKSTLVKSILGQQAYTGEISFSPANGSRVRPRIGYVPQSPGFDRGYPVSVLDLFACCIARRPAFLPARRKFRERVAEILARVHGEGLIDRPVGALSGGEVQRVLLALALEPVPNLLVLDEPLSGVDIEGSEHLLSMLDEIRTNYDLSVLMITHDFSSLPRCDSVVLLDRSVLLDGPPDLVLASPEFREAFHMGGNPA